MPDVSRRSHRRRRRQGHADGRGSEKAVPAPRGPPVLHWSLEAMEQAPSVEEVVVVAGEEDVDRLRREVSPLFAKVTAVVAGGATRQESVARGSGL